MKYTRFDPYQMKNHRIIWSCNFEPTNAKESAKGCNLEDLAWSKAVNIRARIYADTEAECIEAYNDCIMQNIKHLIILAKEYARNILGDVSESDKTYLEKLSNM